MRITARKSRSFVHGTSTVPSTARRAAHQIWRRTDEFPLAKRWAFHERWLYAQAYARMTLDIERKARDKICKANNRIQHNGVCTKVCASCGTVRLFPLGTRLMTTRRAWIRRRHSRTCDARV